MAFEILRSKRTCEHYCTITKAQSTVGEQAGAVLRAHPRVESIDITAI